MTIDDIPYNELLIPLNTVVLYWPLEAFSGLPVRAEIIEHLDNGLTPYLIELEAGGEKEVDGNSIRPLWTNKVSDKLSFESQSLSDDERRMRRFRNSDEIEDMR